MVAWHLALILLQRTKNVKPVWLEINLSLGLTLRHMLLKLSPMGILIQVQEPMTRSVQLLLTLATAFSQVGLFLDTPFPRKFVADDVRIKEDQEPIAPDGS